MIVDDLATDTRFSGPESLRRHGVVSGVSTPIRGVGRDLGILSAHTTVARPFGLVEASFLDPVAGVAGAAIARLQAEEQLRATVQRLERSEEIRIQLRHGEAGAVLAVEHEGDGIDPAYLDQIFEPFVQGPTQQQAAQPGTGLGLTLARELVALHGGSLTATNRAERGARFEVVLPGAMAEPLPSPPLPPRGARG